MDAAVPWSFQFLLALKEFQILQGHDWSKRYYPSTNKSTVEGPGNVHGRNFRITALPAECCLVKQGMCCYFFWAEGAELLCWNLFFPAKSLLVLCEATVPFPNPHFTPWHRGLHGTKNRSSTFHRQLAKASGMQLEIRWNLGRRQVSWKCCHHSWELCLGDWLVFRREWDTHKQMRYQQMMKIPC
jgi:hypothetical protein